MSSEEKQRSEKVDEETVDAAFERVQILDKSLELTPLEEKRLLRRVDLRIVPYASLWERFYILVVRFDDITKPYIPRLYLLSQY